MRRRGDRVILTTGKYAGHFGAVKADIYLMTVDYPGEWVSHHAG
jgi:hypothetical protein